MLILRHKNDYMSQQDVFFDVLRFSLGITDRLEATIDDAGWMSLFEMADRQSLVGVLFQGIGRLPKERRPVQKQVFFTWLAASEMIRQANHTVCEHAAAIVRQFQADGYACCLLKGQGNALLYPDSAVRTPGDIDLWVVKEGVDGPAVREVVSYVRQRSASAGQAIYHHIDYGTFEGTDVEVHYRPSFMHNPLHNRRLQRFFQQQARQQMAHTVDMGGGKVAVPTTGFNRIYLLVHIARHLFQTGIGLRQFVDYYYVLRQGLTETERAETRLTLSRCGLNDVAGAVMYVMKQLFWLDEACMPVAPDERRGRFLLNEVIQGGNFGQYDQRIGRFGRTSLIGKNLERLRRDWRTVWLFPSESLWEPLFRLWHFGWRWCYR